MDKLTYSKYSLQFPMINSEIIYRDMAEYPVLVLDYVYVFNPKGTWYTIHGSPVQFVDTMLRDFV